MATTVSSSHTRELSIPEFIANPNFSFPAPPPPKDDAFSFQPRRGSMPLLGGATPAIRTRQRSGSGDAIKHPQRNTAVFEVDKTAPASPFQNPSPFTNPSRPSHGRMASRVVAEGTTPTVLNASVKTGPLAGKHNREVSELLTVPTLETSTDEKIPSPQPSPKSVPPPPPGGARPRRGHAHRRSGAISSSDVWSLMQQPPPPLPNQPAAEKKSCGLEAPEMDANRLSPKPSPRMSLSVPVSPNMVPDTKLEDMDNDVHPSLAQRRKSRVSFIEDAEVIPESPCTEPDSPTTTKGHAGADSISSQATITAPRITVNTNTGRNSPPMRRPHNRTRSNSQTLQKPTAASRAHSDRDRPSTAGAILATPTQEKQSDSSYFPDMATTMAADSGAEVSPCTARSKKVHKKAKSDFSAFMMTGNLDGSPQTGEEPKKKKKKKKVKNWAGQILGKKKKPSKKGRTTPLRSPTPVTGPEDGPQGPQEWVATSWNQSYVMMPVDTLPSQDFTTFDFPARVASPMIDLDAALGPLKSPTANSSQIAAAAKRRRMHSSAGRPSGGYFHRRSESMPEMQLFALEDDINRQMEDVFEEDEEEESTEDDSSSDESSEEDEDEGLGIGIVDHSKDSAIEDSGKRLSNSTVTKNSALLLDFDVPRHTRGSSWARRKSAPPDILTPIMSPATELPPPLPAPATLSPTSPTSKPPGSPSTFHTANSNLNTPVNPEFEAEAGYEGFKDYLGEPGPEMRGSVDDVPSLTSSRSTMTMSTAYPTMPSTPSIDGIASFSQAGSISGVSGKSGKKEKREKGGKGRWRLWNFWKLK